ncbi:papain fold toxin 1 (glutamine deamidase) of polymorphic toxin system [Saccharopolyspora erythraea NRRL 2338]|uniref:Uncharacterized protein n=2 Tax=Saccharopolyspora erythraea TaxID=1836 RepID=A4F7A8_SACEN|nr:toxin glutamine deamidase domain-containing protein [Saccharopolyspora erythraea]EQD86373.1 hypothetical protein N599_09910 [Saccharopolyspora erythraea D]PFG93733.1 papain fold toxin 1 (glutamine deamidase) of polymorphic toxin system [Saccharopolyspora erythraea NRRL 2338]QRK90573.1 hypothetical protein JQX30_03480 [Saccharopolyspora erythraea]CAL99932.1 hypothetical protein SACE_0587 [Saccharopolyspora erythraea NRRL 2338]
MINPAEIPQIPGDMDALAGHASTLKTAGAAFASTGADVHAKWQGLAAVYDAPEAGQLLNATQPVSAVSDTVGGNVETVAGALSTYATTVKPIKARLESLRAQAQTFVSSVEGDDDWREDEGKVNQHNQLLSQVNEAVAEWMEAQRTCANAINAVYGGTQYAADNGDGRRDPNEFGYTKDQLNSALGEGLPWGKAEEHDGGFWGDVGDFFVGIKDGAVQMVTDLGALIGYANGEWSWSTAGAAWKGLGTFALALGTYANPLAIVADQTIGLPGFKRGEMGGTLLNAGKSIIAYDQWGKGHNGRAAGQATFNIVSAVVGTKGAGAGLKGAGAAIQGGKVAGMAAKVGGGMVRAGDFVAKMPTVGELGIKLANKLNIHIPHLGPTPALAGDGPSFGHRVDTDIADTRGPDVARMDNGGPRGGGPSVGDGLHHTPDGHHGGGTPPGGNTATDGPRDSGVPDGRQPSDSHVGGSHHGNGHVSGDGTTLHNGDRPIDSRTPFDGHTQVEGHAPVDGHTPDGDRPDGDHTSSPDGGDPSSTSPAPGADTPALPERLGNQPDGSWVNVEHGTRYDLSPEMNAAVDRYLGGASVTEGHVTPHVRSIADGIDGARLQGYPDFVLKGEDSFKRKFAQDLARYPDLSPDEILANVKDSVRYTIEMPSRNYTDGVLSAVDDLRARGYENVTFKPTWENPDTYKGVNSTWRDPATGRVFELQFHTPDSFKAKMDTHGLYEAERVATDEADRLRAAEAQAEIFRQVDVPDHAIDRLHELKQTLEAERAAVDPADHAPPQHPDADGHGHHDGNPAPGPADPGDPAGHGDGAGDAAPDWSAVSGTTDVNSKPALHSGTATPEQAQRYVAEHHPYVVDVNVDRFQRGVPGSDQNCSRCVRAVDLGFTGTPASALPWPEGPGWGLSSNTFADYARSLGADPAAFRQVSSYDDIIGDMTARGEGARGMVYIGRPGSAHVFNVVHDQNGVVFLDGQTGGLALLEKNVNIMYLPIGR